MRNSQGRREDKEISKCESNFDMERKLAWNRETVYVLRIYEKFLGLIGVWPLNAENIESNVRWSLAMLIQITTISHLSLEIYRRCVDLDDTMDAFLMLLSSLVSMSKLMLSGLNCRYTRTLVSSIIEDFSILVDSSERKVVMRYATKGRLVSSTILYLGYVSGMSFVLKTLPIRYVLSSGKYHNSNETEDSSARTYFLSTYCVFGEQSGFPRAAILLLQAVQIFVNATSHCGTDGFFFGMAMYLCGQFELLRMNFADLRADESDFRKKLDSLIRRHCRLIRLAENLEEAFNAIILVQLLMSVLLLCVEGIQTRHPVYGKLREALFGSGTLQVLTHLMLVSLGANDTVASIKHAVLIVTMLVQLFLYSYAGDMLESKTEELVLGVYDSPWYDFDASFVRNLSFIILHGKIPRRVTAGKFVSINLFTYKEIVKTSASYMSVLRIMLAD